MTTSLCFSNLFCLLLYKSTVHLSANRKEYLFRMISVSRNKINSLIMNFSTFVVVNFHASYIYEIKINYKTIYHNSRTVISHELWFKSCGFINFVTDAI